MMNDVFLLLASFPSEECTWAYDRGVEDRKRCFSSIVSTAAECCFVESFHEPAFASKQVCVEVIVP